MYMLAWSAAILLNFRWCDVTSTALSSFSRRN